MNAQAEHERGISGSPCSPPNPVFHAFIPKRKWWAWRRLTGQTARDLEVQARCATSSRKHSVECGHMLQSRQISPKHTLNTKVHPPGPGTLPEGALDKHFENVKLSKFTRLVLLAITWNLPNPLLWPSPLQQDLDTFLHPIARTTSVL